MTDLASSEATGERGGRPYNRRLGVCIPTYKRPDQLRRCVESIIAAAAPFDVPIFITDNAADDTNRAVIAELRARYPHIVYALNEENVGIDRNVQRCINLCDCDYAWGIGDDDRMLPGAVGAVLEALERDSPAFLCVNYSYVDEDVAVVLREKLLPLEADRDEDAAAFFREDAWAIGFLGSCVVNKALWRAVSPAPYLDTYFAHVGVILESVAGRRVSLLAEPQVLNRVGGAEVFTWSGDAYGVFQGFPAVARRLAPVYGAEAAEEAAATFVRRHGLDTLRFMLARRGDRAYNLDVYRRFVRDSRRGRLHKMAAYLVATIPPAPARALRVLFSLMRRRSSQKVGAGRA
jgi:glycosyltransferase involved in cell wall biosynthesis